MTYQECLATATERLEAARQLIETEIRSYPAPVAGCDAQFNHLVGMRGSISEALAALPDFDGFRLTAEPGAFQAV
ncbi:MAG: hypothetical protein F4213_21520, partial [Boseongicola sp. SB0677_bin_26]|nr:hypothetical protein [Boseongicola sp. SB0665_bin_10]MYG28562.1 hypothetical protein [Boseongicola sp. SB0677_bin_26]